MPATTEFVRVPEPPKYEPLHLKAKRERSVIVELDTPRHLEIDGFVKEPRNYMKMGRMSS